MLTKQDLLNVGITEVTPDCKVYKNGKLAKLSQNKTGYYTISVYILDDNGNKIRKPIRRRQGDTWIDTYVYKSTTLTLQRIMWAWFKGEVPDGMVVDHIDNQHTSLSDYRIENLQLLTPRENLKKDRRNSWGSGELPCNLEKPREYYENILNTRLNLYEFYKTVGDKDKLHSLRGGIAYAKARLRYYDNHLDIAERIQAEKEAELIRKQERAQRIREHKLIAEYKKMFRASQNTAMWHQLVDVEKKWDTLTPDIKEHVFNVLRDTYDLP